MRKLRFLWMLLCVSLFLASPAMAQNTASIEGNVTDSSGAAMPNVKITVSLPSRGFSVSTVSDAAGAYKVGFLGIGTYTVTAEAAGFQKLVQENVVLDIGQTQRVDLTMKVGTTTQEVTITGNAVRVQTDDSVISSVITGSQIQAINLNGREFIALATLVPGANYTNSYNPSGSQGEGLSTYVTFNGTSYDRADWAADGGNLFNFFANGNFHTTPSLESIGEFKISTSNYEADSGLRSGALVEMTTKSGTKDFHGDMYDYIRNDFWDSNPWFVNQELWSGLPASDCVGGNKVTGPCNAPKTPLKWNDFGFTFGGPFYIPGHYNTNKEKTFFFWSTEWRRIRTGTTLTASAPTARMRNGDFSECDPHSANYNSLISGCTVPSGTGITGDSVTTIAPQATLLLNTWVPMPNNGPTGYIQSPSIPNNWRQNLIRVDQNIGDRNRVFLKVASDKDGYFTLPTLYSSAATYDSVRSFYGGITWNWAAHWTHTFSPSIVNDFMAHYDERYNKRYDVPGVGWPAVVLGKPTGWSMPTLFPANQAWPYMPGFTVSGGTGLSAFGEDVGYLPEWTVEANQEYQDTLQITKGHHYMKVGINFTWSQGDFNNTANQGATTVTAEGELTFSTSATNTTHNAFADMLLGNIYQYQESTPINSSGQAVGGYFGFRYITWRYEPYFQDDWRVTKRLTVNLGVRAFWLTPWEDKSAAWNLKWHGSSTAMLAGFFPNQYNPAVQAPLNAAGYVTPNAATGQIYDARLFGNGLVACNAGGSIPSGCMYTQPIHFAPRFGFAYQPFSASNTVVRGGFGMFYDQMSDNDPGPITLDANVPIYQVATANNINGYTAISPTAFGPSPFSAIATHMPYPKVMNYYLGVQHEFKGNNRFALSYVGTIANHNARTEAFNRVPINTTTELIPALAGTADCDTSGNCNVQASLINSKHSINFFRPYQAYTTISEKNTSARSIYQGLQAELRHPVGHGLTVEAAYTFSKWMDDSDSYSTDYNIDDGNLRRYWAPSSYNRTNVVSLQYVYDLPFLKNNPNHYVKNAFGGWQVTGVSSFFDGLRINITCSESGYGTGVGANAQCNSLAPVRRQKGIDDNPTYGPEVQWYNPANVGQLQLAQLSANGQPGEFGYMGINPLAGPGRNNWDLALLKNFSAPWFKGEHSTVQFRWETYNTFNHPEWQGISTGCDSTTPFGTACNTQVISGKTYNIGRGDVTSAWPQRIMQFALKFIF